jgi:hypothetical protein
MVNFWVWLGQNTDPMVGGQRETQKCLGWGNRLINTRYTKGLNCFFLFFQGVLLTATAGILQAGPMWGALVASVACIITGMTSFL